MLDLRCEHSICIGCLDIHSIQKGEIYLFFVRTKTDIPAGMQQTQLVFNPPKSLICFLI